ncbi:TetR/AcrR family transcriptional regulator [Clostridium sp. OS1-26]|uniref:TetR/AcrR family transcriptional regulator n=1 Tax=Clostridium sp. OS1-26 TaxID=3070681 RepID=UPI0027DFA70E|nr:TetR/AcrR family transcriptional regulator [Clostridium sp. OS1-26]WML32683.1 TetR/AcrR family transcriptional regulator [Clostridium sp. OS1-26]
MLKSENDRRAIRTKKMIRKALSELIEEKGLNNISITDLTTRADINRGTFYLHYTDKYDLLEKVEDEIMQEIQEQTKGIDYINMMNIDVVNEPIPFIIKLFEYFKENANFMKAILGPKGDPLFLRKLKKFTEINLFEMKLVKTFNKENMLIPEEYFISYLISAHLGVVQQWLESGMNKSPKEMALTLSKMSLLGPFRAAGLKNNTDRR